MSNFVPTGNFVARGADKVDPALVSILKEAADRVGMRVEAYSGYRPGDKRAHGRGKATDIRLFGPDGKMLPNYQSAETFPIYEKFAHEARRVQMEKYPHLDKNFRWGGYFSGGRGKYGAMDLMHFDLAGGNGLGMAGGSWEKGLSDQQKKLFPGAQSQGLGMMALVDRPKPAAFDPTQFGAIALDGPAEPRAPGLNAIDAMVKPVVDLPTNRPGYQVVPTSRATPVAFDPVAAGAIPFDPVNAGAVPVTPPMQPPVINQATGQPQGVPEFVPPGVDGYNPQTGEVERTSAEDKIGAFLYGVADLPIVGPAVHAGQKAIAAGAVAPFSDKSFGEVYDEMGNIQQETMADNPGTTLAGNVTGALGTLVPLGATNVGGTLLGVAGRSLGSRAFMSAASNAGINAADTAVRGGSDQDVARSASIGGALGGAIPVVGAALGALGRSVKETVGPRFNSLVRPTQEAERRVGTALGADAANKSAPVLGASDEASAAVNNQQLLNVDRGGEATRALARSAANTDPEARAIINKTAQDRFASQGERARSFIDRISGGTADDLAAQDALDAAAKAANKPAYAKAYKAPAAQDMWDTEFASLMQAPALREAAKAAEGRGANRAVVEGFQPVKSPFTEVNGKISLRVNQDGSIARPTLQFWDQVKRNLDGEIGKASRAGDKTLVGDLKALKTKLVAKLDKAVPEYSTARRGAAVFFDADDALEAGKKFVTQNRTLDETGRVLAKMSPAERELFAVGFAAEMKDAIKQTGDSVNVIKKIFGSDQARQKVRLALGPKNFREFEQFVKVENAMDALRGAMGNSTTARQLAELGLAGGTGVGATMLTGDWKQGLGAAVLTGLARKGGAKIDERITKQIAQMLLSDDPKMLQRAVTMASKNPQASKALDAIYRGVDAALKSVGNVSGRKPLEITVTEPAGVSP